jgi:hypothetical protein
VSTGFFINDQGLFVTARHVIEDVLRDGEQVLPLVILHLRSEIGLFGPSECLFRPIGQCWLGDVADVGLGVAAPATNNNTGEILRNWTWTLSWSVPQVGAPASTYAFPNHVVVENGRRIRFSPDAYAGSVQAIGSFRDSVRIPFPYLQVDFRIHGAASGGPIFVGGHVVGINCSEYVNIDHPPGPGFGAQSRCLADTFLDNVILQNEAAARRVTFDQLVCTGCIHVENYVPRSSDEPSRGTLIQLSLDATAPRPEIETQIYA